MLSSQSCGRWSGQIYGSLPVDAREVVVKPYVWGGSAAVHHLAELGRESITAGCQILRSRCQTSRPRSEGVVVFVQLLRSATAAT